MSAITIKLETRSLSSLTPHSANAKGHSDSQIEQIAASITQFGFRDPIGILPDGKIVEGEGRWRAAQSLGMEDVPVIVFDGMEEREADLYRIAHNKLTLITGFDVEVLVETLRSVTGDDVEIETLGFGGRDSREIMRSFASATGDEDAATVETAKSGFDIVFDTEEQRGEWRAFMSSVVEGSEENTSETEALIKFIEASGALTEVAEEEPVSETQHV